METKTYTKRINQLERRVTTLEEILTTIRPTNIQQDIWERSAGIISKKRGQVLLRAVERGRQEWNKRDKELEKLWKKRVR